MVYALRGGLTLAILLFVLHIFIPDISSGLVEIILKMIQITNLVLDGVLRALQG